MKILILGGSQFVGRHIVDALIPTGHSISIFNRGKTDCNFPNRVEHLKGDRDNGTAGLDALAGRLWDVCVDVNGYTAKQVRACTEMLCKNVGHYVFVSAVSVYGDPSNDPIYESRTLSPPADEDVLEITDKTYGPLKVTCENIVQEKFTGRCTLLRPQIIAGAYDPFDRFSYWVRRADQGGKMLVPGDGSDYLQYIDAGDFARFTRTVCEKMPGGIFNLAGPRLTWKDFVTKLEAENIIWVPKEILTAAGVTEFELPLYRPTGSPRSSLMHISNEKAVAAGLTLTDPTVTVMNVRKWIQESSLSPALSKEYEAALIKLSQSN